MPSMQQSRAMADYCPRRPLEQADGRFDLESDPQNIGDATDLFAKGVNERFNGASQPGSAWWDGTASGLDISAISVAGPQMTFTGNV